MLKELTTTYFPPFEVILAEHIGSDKGGDLSSIVVCSDDKKLAPYICVIHKTREYDKKLFLMAIADCRGKFKYIFHVKAL